MARYDGKRVLVTGGAGGIGFAAAELLSREGARVLITGRDAAALESARARLGAGVSSMASDATSRADIAALADQVRTQFGQLDALLICAGQTRFTPFEKVDEAAYDQLFAVNAKGPFFTVQALAPLMARGSGVVFVTSVAGVRGTPMIDAYAASKAALRSMARSLARDLVDRGVRVNAVSPGAIETGILEKSAPLQVAAKAREQITANNPMKRFGAPEEVARALVFLAFEATYTTGAELPVDGGSTQL